MKSVVTYGASEYKDIISAIKYAHHKTKSPIIVHGICAGAYHATHAIFELQNSHLIEAYNVRGLIFDSGWDTIWTVARTALTSECIAYLKKSPLVPSWSAPIGIWSAGTGIMFAHLLLTPLFMITPHRKPLNAIISHIQTPIFYIHMENDCYANSWSVQKLAARTPQAHTWWITAPSKHACHHLKHKEEYRTRVLNFIDEVL